MKSWELRIIVLSGWISLQNLDISGSELSHTWVIDPIGLLSLFSQLIQIVGFEPLLFKVQELCWAPIVMLKYSQQWTAGVSWTLQILFLWTFTYAITMYKSEYLLRLMSGCSSKRNFVGFKSKLKYVIRCWGKLIKDYSFCFI